MMLFIDKFRKWEIMARSKFEIWVYHLKELVLSFHNIIKSLKLDHQNSSYVANSSTLNIQGAPALNEASLNVHNFSSVGPSH